MSKHESLAVRVPTSPAVNASVPASMAMHVGARQVRSLAPTVFCPSAQVDTCVNQMRRARVSQ